MRKSSDVLLLGVTNTILVLRFTRSNTFYYFQTAKVVHSKDVITKSPPADVGLATQTLVHIMRFDI